MIRSSIYLILTLSLIFVDAAHGEIDQIQHVSQVSQAGPNLRWNNNLAETNFQTANDLSTMLNHIITLAKIEPIHYIVTKVVFSGNGTSDIQNEVFYSLRHQW